MSTAFPAQTKTSRPSDDPNTDSDNHNDQFGAGLSEAELCDPAPAQNDPALEKVDSEHGVAYAKKKFSADARGKRDGLRIEATFCPEDGRTPFATTQWDLRSAAIKDETGKVLFEQTDCEVPASWSQLATNVVVSKYFYGDPTTKGERERSVRQLIHRVTRTITDWGLADGYFDTPEDGDRFYRDLTWLCLHQHGAFNSPVWFNVGLHAQYGVEGDMCNWHWDKTTNSTGQPDNPYEFPQGSACFIQSVDDNMEDIMRLACSEAMLFKFGSGTGTDLSTIRSQREKLSGGGTPSGPLSFMRVYDSIAGVVKSGGKTRRAAKMQSLKVWHPDILEFIECKWAEEKKAHALIREGYESNFNGEAYSSVCFQNANLSVRLTDDFMETVRKSGKWQTRWVTNKPTTDAPVYDAKELLNKMAECAWHCGDPGVQYDTTINKWHTCPNSGAINASNPCVTGDTLVSTSTGYRRIIDLVGKTAEIINGNGKIVSIDRIFKTGTKPVYKLVTRSGYSLKLTADHQVHTENRGDVPACELTRDDIIRLEKVGFGDDFVPSAFGELLGAALGDGCITTGANDQDFLFVSLGSHERSIAARLQEGVSSIKQWLAIEDGRSNRPSTITETSTGIRVGTSVSAILEKLKQYAVLDAGSAEKAFSDAVFNLDRPSQVSILQGLFSADGTVADYGQKSQYVALDSTSEKMLEQVQLLLLGFGIKSKIYRNRRALTQTTALMPDGNGGEKEYSVAQMHSLRISRASRVAFADQIGFLPESEKQTKLLALNERVSAYADPMVDRVDRLEACGVEDVYDLTEPQSNHFVANGMVIHNCSEYMFLDDTACNLASINLMKFVQKDGSFNVDRFRAAARTFFIAQEILVDHASYPTEPIARNSHLYRPLGLGYSNLGSVIMTSGLAYDSDAARGVCGSLTALLHGEANRTSAEMAAVVGPFEGFAGNEEPMHRVMQMHRDACEQIHDGGPPELKEAAIKLWDEVTEIGKKYGFRNAQATVLAPTGTISFMMDCDTTGIEPDIALVKYKQLAGGGMLKIVNQTVKLGLKTLGYDQDAIDAILKFVDENDTIEGAPGLKDEHLSVFDCAFKPANGVRSIPWRAHVTMMAAAQPFLSGAISKTVNMPTDVTPEDIADAYFWGWELGLKAIAIYRDGSKQSQPLNTKQDDKQGFGSGATQVVTKTVEKIVYKPRRERLPDTRQSLTHKFTIAGHEGYLCVGLYPDGRPGEIFITMAKEGSTIGGIMDSFGTALSIALQYGVPLDVIVNKFSHTRFEPMGHTSNKDIRIAKSVVDYIARWLGITFMSGHDHGMQSSPGNGPELASGNEVLGGISTTTGVMIENGVVAAGAPAAKQSSVMTSLKNDAGAAVAIAERAIMMATLGVTNGISIDGGEANGSHQGNGEAQLVGQADQFSRFQTDAPSCDNCGSITVRNGNCYLCHNCGNSMGCS
ncbi:LAGLIDADG family homing endonuclease [Neorhodopirellula pilleata]